MEEMSPAVAVPFRVGNSLCDNQTIATHIDITTLLMADKGGLLSDSVTKASNETVVAGDEDLANEVPILVAAMPKENKGGGAPMLDMVSQNESNWVAGDDVIVSPESEEDDSLSLEGDQILDSSCSLSVASESSSLCGEEILGLEALSDLGTQNSIETVKSLCGVNVVAKAGNPEEPNDETEMVSDPVAVAVAVSLEEEIGDGSDPKRSAVLQLPLERRVSGTSGRSVFEVDYVPLWGFTSMCGRRPEMEDAVAVVPRFLKIPVQTLIGDRVLDGMTNCLPHQTVHFFGVYDGHGGSQVPFILFSSLLVLI
jgi:protein phosphatase 2C